MAPHSEHAPSSRKRCARHGRRSAITYAIAYATVYPTWYAVYAMGDPKDPDTRGLRLQKDYVKVPQFVGVMLLLGWQSISPVFGVGAIALIAALIVLARMGRSGTKVEGLSPALILTGAAALFAFMTAYSRAECSL